MTDVAPLPTDASVLQKADAILSAFRGASDGLRLVDIARRTGLAKTTTRRLTHELVSLDYLERDGEFYRIGVGLSWIGTQAFDRRRLRKVAAPHMKAIRDITGELVLLGTLERGSIRPDRVAATYHSADGIRFYGPMDETTHRRAEYRTGFDLPQRTPLNCTATGRVLLAYSEPSLLDEVISAGLESRTPNSVVDPDRLRTQVREVRRAGFSVAHEDSVLGISSVAVPIFDGDGHVAAALTISAPTGRLETWRLLPPMRSAATAITRELAARVGPSA